MLFLLALCLAALFVFLLRDPLKKHPYWFYAGAAVITLLLSLWNIRGVPAWVNQYVLGLFQRGALATALWVIVMFTGAFHSAALRKHLMPIRGELSILAAVMTLCHNIFYGKIYFKGLFQSAGFMSTMQRAAAGISILMLLIMIPLTILSFPQIRRKMAGKAWKRIQRLAYGFYALLYVHVVLVMLPMAQRGVGTYRLDVILYSLVFLAYFIGRIQKALQKKDGSNKSLLRIVGAIVLVVLMAGVVLLTQGPKKAPAIEETIPTTVPETTAPETTAPSESVPETTVPETTQPEDTTAPTEAEETEATEPEETKGTKPTEPKETEGTKPTEPKPTEPKPTEPKPTETEPTVPETTVPETTPPTQAPRKYKDGVYTGYGNGFTPNSEQITAIVTIENDQIVSIQASSSLGETYYLLCAQEVIPYIIANQSTNIGNPGDIDAVSGATYTAKGILAAVDGALAQARI